LVKLFGSPFDYNLIHRCDKIVKFISIYQPELKSHLTEKSSTFENAIQGLFNKQSIELLVINLYGMFTGLGIHGLTHITNEHGIFQSLYNSIKKELQVHVENFKSAINVIDENEFTCDPAQASHQRLLAFKYDDVQQRLIKNVTLLTKLEHPGLKQYESLVNLLRQRVEKDKEVLFSVNEIKKLDRDIDLKEW
jgi:hypothetical protein